ncbi:MAG: hypothetical protein JJE39_04600 [Vicinamibacteria bacterium]|nr:hypothetical protein [Vicinamibacteria bacterium]
MRSLAADLGNPGRVYLGASGGRLYRSDLSGDHWQRLSPGFPRPDQNLDDIVVSPRGDLMIGFWDVHGRGGGVAMSSDGGLSFTIALDGESVRAVSLDPSDPSHAVVGTLSGVFASWDSGHHWRRISPAGHPELRNVESVAVDPRDPRIIYAGTWHLPWKTMDGGATWKPVPYGLIDDSDVFTMTLDRRNPLRVFASACSGIYGSNNGAATWSKVQGIPFRSRRSRAFAQDLLSPDTFYAGTTEGLWVSGDDTATWQVKTPQDLVVNAIVALPDGSVLAGAEGAGVLRSLDQGRSWIPANEGFSERFVASIAVDSRSGRVLAGVWGDRVSGGVFSAPTARGEWTRLGEGLKGRTVRSLGIADALTLAGTDQGLFSIGAADRRWRRIALTEDPTRPYPRIDKVAVLRGEVVVVGTSAGLYRRDPASSSFLLVLRGPGEVTAIALAPAGSLSLVATPSDLYQSRDEGRTWRPLTRPGLARINALSVAPTSGVILAATSRGLYRSIDEGRSWRLAAQGLPESDFTSLAASPEGGTVFVSDFTWGGVYRSDDAGVSWRRLGVGGLATDRVWALALDRSTLDLLAASLVGGLHVTRVLDSSAAPPN